MSSAIQTLGSKRAETETVLGVAVLSLPHNPTLLRIQDYAELIKARVTSLVVMTAWCGYYFGSFRSGVSSLSIGLFHALLGIGLVAGGTAALNEVIEHDIDGKMRRTAIRPLPGKRMSLTHATLLGAVMAFGGAIYLMLATNILTGGLALATAAIYLGVYTPLKKIHPVCRFVGAFPGAMPGVLGWTAARGHPDWETLALFAIVFFWQFPHFFSIAWLYREDYERGSIRMLPVVDADGRSTVRKIVFYSLALIPATLLPTFLHMSGTVYALGALALGIGLLWFGVRLAWLHLPPAAPRSKVAA